MRWSMLVLAALAAGCGTRKTCPPVAPGSHSSSSCVLIEVGGPGTVATADGKVTCTGTCAVEVPTGTAVALRATATSGSELAGWGAACGPAGTADEATVTPEGNVVCTAQFLAGTLWDDERRQVRCVNLRFSPDGRTLACSETPNAARTRLSRIDSGRTLAEVPGAAEVAFSADSASLVYTTRDGWITFDVLTGRKTVAAGSTPFGHTAVAMDPAGEWWA
jgi:hypothetical protein